LRNVRQADAVRVFVGWGGVERARSKRGHRIVKLPNGRVASFPSGVLKIGLLLHEIKMADKTPEEFVDAL
jgi:hypothetical protein